MTNFRLFQTERVCRRQFQIFPRCFQKACFPGASKGVIVWEWVKKGQNFTLFQIENICKGGKLYLIGEKTFWEKEKKQITCICSSEHKVREFTEDNRKFFKLWYLFLTSELVSWCCVHRAWVSKLFHLKTSHQKLLTGFLLNFTGMLLKWSSLKFL